MDSAIEQRFLAIGEDELYGEEVCNSAEELSANGSDAMQLSITNSMNSSLINSAVRMAAVIVESKCKQEEEMAFMWSLVMNFTDMSELRQNIDACIAHVHTQPRVQQIMMAFKISLEKHEKGSGAAAVNDGNVAPQIDIFNIASLVITLLKLIIQILTNDPHTNKDVDLTIRRLDRVLGKLQCVQKFIQAAFEGWQAAQKNQEDFFMDKQRKWAEQLEGLQKQNEFLQTKMAIMEEEQKKTDEYAEWIVCRKHRRDASAAAK